MLHKKIPKEEFKTFDKGLMNSEWMLSKDECLWWYKIRFWHHTFVGSKYSHRFPHHLSSSFLVFGYRHNINIATSNDGVLFRCCCKIWHIEFTYMQCTSAFVICIYSFESLVRHKRRWVRVTINAVTSSCISFLPILGLTAIFSTIVLNLHVVSWCQL